MNSRFTLALGAVVVGACTTMAMQDGGLARADDPPAAASKAEVIALQNAFDDTVNALTARLERLEADRDELQTTVAELESRSPGLGAYDAEGNWLGTAMDYTAGDDLESVKWATIWHPAVSRVFTIASTDQPAPLFFTQPGCSGNTYLADSAAFKLGSFQAASGLLWVPTGAKTKITHASSMVSGTCSDVEPAERDAYLAKSIVPPFPLPVSWPVALH